jgi:lipopolysaccharide export system permease protein
MNLLNRYILGAFVRVFALSLGAFVGIYLLVEFFEKVDDFIEYQAAPSDYLVYFGAKIPLVLTQVTPLAVLLAAFMTLGGFSRTNELTAMRAGGISLWRISAPILAVGLAASITVLALAEYIVPPAAAKTNYTLEISVRGKTEEALKRENLWFREGQSIIHVDIAAPEENKLAGIRSFLMDEDFRILTRFDAPRAEYRDGEWIAEQAVLRHFDPGTGELIGMERHALSPVAMKRSPKEFEVSEARNDEMTFQELRRLAQRLQAEGYEAVRYRVDLQARLAMPFSNLIMAFLGIPFALRKGRGTSLAVGVSIALAIGLTYYLLQSFLMAFGYASALSPLIAAWAPNLLFLLLGIWLLLTVRE